MRYHNTPHHPKSEWSLLAGTRVCQQYIRAPFVAMTIKYCSLFLARVCWAFILNAHTCAKVGGPAWRRSIYRATGGGSACCFGTEIANKYDGNRVHVSQSDEFYIAAFVPMLFVHICYIMSHSTHCNCRSRAACVRACKTHISSKSRNKFARTPCNCDVNVL